jgi:exodeoxyribonuclease VII small subunit
VKPNGETPDFEAGMQRLEAIVQELERGGVGLERAMQLFEEGLALGATCRAQLDGAQARIERLLVRADGGAEIASQEPPAP